MPEPLIVFVAQEWDEHHLSWRIVLTPSREPTEAEAEVNPQGG